MDWKNKGKLVILVGLLFLFLCGCGKQEKQTVQFFAMDTIMQMTAYGEQATDALQLAREKIEDLGDKLNANNPDSELSKLSTGKTLPDFIQYPLNIEQQISAFSGGALDVRLYPLTKAWGFYSKDYRVPDSVEVQQILNNLGEWKIEENTFLCSDKMKLDLGSLAKGYAASQAVEILKQNGITSAILSLGGNVQTLGQKPDGSDWVVSVADPLQDGSSVGDLHIGESAVVTSGSYQRNFTKDGKLYHHILDPKTGYPVDNELLSVTVLCADGTMADGLSTALYVVGLERAMELYKQGDIPFEALFITKDHTIQMTKGLSTLFTLTNETYTVLS